VVEYRLDVVLRGEAGARVRDRKNPPGRGRTDESVLVRVGGVNPPGRVVYSTLYGGRAIQEARVRAIRAGL
jgi:hypothetical protein